MEEEREKAREADDSKDGPTPPEKRKGTPTKGRRSKAESYAGTGHTGVNARTVINADSHTKVDKKTCTIRSKVTVGHGTNGVSARGGTGASTSTCRKARTKAQSLATIMHMETKARKYPVGNGKRKGDAVSAKSADTHMCKNRIMNKQPKIMVMVSLMLNSTNVCALIPSTIACALSLAS